MESRYVSQREERSLRWLSVGLISLIAFETLAVATAMPTVVHALRGENLYALAMGVVMAAQLMTTVIAGPWSDSRGPQSCLYTGVILFAAGLLIATFSPTMESFVLGRTIQGLGGGLCVVPLYTLIGNHIQPERQPSFFAAFAAAWVLPALVGPAIAGLIVAHASWRYVFGIVPALLVLAFPSLVVATKKLPHLPRAALAPAAGKRSLLAIGAGCSVGALQVLSGTDEHFTPLTFVLIALAGAATVALIRPLLPHHTLTAGRGLPATILVRGITNGTFVGVETFLPLLLQEIHGWNPTQAGIVLTVGSVTWAIGSGIAGRITLAHQRAQLPITGAFVQLLGILIALLGTQPHVTGGVVVIGWTLSGFGIGLLYPTMTVHALGMTAPEFHGRTSSALQLADTLGAALCVAFAGIVYALLQGNPHVAFAGAIALMAFVMAGGTAVVHRISPLPGSEEAQQLAAS